MASGKKIIGKPSREFFHLAAASLGYEPKDILMIGDDIESDIKGTKDAGFKTALVKTGKFSQSDLKKGITPDFIIEDVTRIEEILSLWFKLEYLKWYLFVYLSFASLLELILQVN